ncbi:zf-HC2 domain-containing protein [Thermodesulfobacteriota bacterium]
MMLSCKEAAKLVSESLDRSLTFRQRLSLRVHLLMCRFCSRFQKQALLIKEAARRMAHEDEDSSAASHMSLSPEARDRIKSTIEEQIESE